VLDLAIPVFSPQLLAISVQTAKCILVYNSTSRPSALRCGTLIDSHRGVIGMSTEENGRDIFRPYSRSSSFRGVQMCPYSSPNIQHSIPYPYPNT